MSVRPPLARGPVRPYGDASDPKNKIVQKHRYLQDNPNDAQEWRKWPCNEEQQGQQEEPDDSVEWVASHA